jgi:hypothetical protein
VIEVLIWLAEGNLDPKFDYNGSSLADSAGQWFINGFCALIKWLWNCIVSISFWGCLLVCIVAIICFILTKTNKSKNIAILSIFFYVIIQGMDSVFQG